MCGSPCESLNRCFPRFRFNFLVSLPEWMSCLKADSFLADSFSRCLFLNGNPSGFKVECSCGSSRCSNVVTGCSALEFFPLCSNAGSCSKDIFHNGDITRLPRQLSRDAEVRKTHHPRQHRFRADRAKVPVGWQRGGNEVAMLGLHSPVVTTLHYRSGETVTSTPTRASSLRDNMATTIRQVFRSAFPRVAIRTMSTLHKRTASQRDE